MVCHGCYDAPCQLKLSSNEGLQRGGTEELVYDYKRITPVQPTRLFVDARSTAQWRSRGFTSVLNEGGQQTAEENLKKLSIIPPAATEAAAPTARL
ncbi:fatty acid cis/trans isomerase (CTI) [bacterium BMS3Bbin11]|nr:fatty acid cis/trans isomerase (CTI) [bacterium BMS3Bbin11]